MVVSVIPVVCLSIIIVRGTRPPYWAHLVLSVQVKPGSRNSPFGMTQAYEIDWSMQPPRKWEQRDCPGVRVDDRMPRLAWIVNNRRYRKIKVNESTMSMRGGVFAVTTTVACFFLVVIPVASAILAALPRAIVRVWFPCWR